MLYGYIRALSTQLLTIIPLAWNTSIYSLIFTSNMNKRDIPEATIRRLPLYLRTLNRLHNEGQTNLSSKSLAEIMDVKPAQIRKDFSYFGVFGTRGKGYKVERLIDEIRSILKLQDTLKIALVGVGNIGSALLSYPGFDARGFKIKLAFDKDPQLIGKSIGGVKISDIEKMEELIRKHQIKLAIIAVPSASAEIVAKRLAKAEIKGILNFAPINLDLDEEVKVTQVDISLELERLSYYL